MKKTYELTISVLVEADSSVNYTKKVHDNIKPTKDFFKQSITGSTDVFIKVKEVEIEGK